MLEILEMVQRLFPVKQPDVLRLRRGESAHRPRQVHEVGLDRRVHRVHPDFVRQQVRLARIARAAGGDDVRPVVGAAARERNEMIARQ